MAHSTTPNASTRKRVPRMMQSRAHIIEVARDLIAENQASDFSMRELAKRADVSVMTIYNLIGEKDAIIIGILESDFQGQLRYVAPTGENDPFALIMDIASRSIDALFDREHVFRPVLTRLLSPSGFTLMSVFRPRRRQYWVDHLNRAVAAGLLVPTINATEVSKILEDIMRSTTIPWLWGLLDRAQFKAVIGCRFLNVMAGFTTEAGEALLQPMLAELEGSRSHHAKARHRPRRRRGVNGSPSSAS